MALRKIRLDTDPILRKKSKLVTEIDSSIITLLDDMIETMEDASGVGLAAPQVGVLRRIIIIDVGDGLVELINPIIIETKDTQTGEEGCLSLPNKVGIVTRPNYCKVSAINRYNEEIIVEGYELMARALCHEIDHLDGILYTDRLDDDTEVIKV